MPIKVECDECGAVLKARSKMAGKKARCPDCDSILRVPKKRSRSEEEPEEDNWFDAAPTPSASSGPAPGSAAARLAEQRSKKKGSKLPLVLVAIVLLAGGAGAGIYFATQGNGEVENPGPSMDTAKGTVDAVLQGMAGGQPKVLWDAMPPSWQRDVNGLVQEFATKIEPNKEIYDRVFQVIAHLATVMKEKGHLVQNSEYLFASGMFKKGAAINQWSNGVSLVNTLATSEDIKTVEGLKSFDMGKFLGGTGQKVFEYAVALSAISTGPTLKDLGRVTVEQVEADADTALLRITPPALPGLPAEPEEISFAKVEGKWVPVDMARGWTQMISDAKTQIGNMPAEPLGDDEKAALLANINQIDSVLTEIEGIKSQKDFDALMKGMLGNILPEAPPEPVEPKPTDPAPVDPDAPAATDPDLPVIPQPTKPAEPSPLPLPL